MEDLTGIREQIDGIDSQLAELLARRLSIMADVAERKRRIGKPVLDPERERAVLNRVLDMAGDEYATELRMLYTTLFSVSKARQRTLLGGSNKLTEAIAAEVARDRSFPVRSLVACPGIEGAYAQQAAVQMFAAPTILYFNSFDKVFEAVEKGLCPYGILPIENSAAGSVVSVYDSMVKHRFHIVKGLRLKISHVLLGRRGARLEDIREISSHQHALAQCGAFLKGHPEIKVVPATNTAVAAKELSENGRIDQAVIASRGCAELYGLDVLAEDISDARMNYTRFICISKNLEIFNDARKLSIMLILPHRPGSLNDILSRFAAIEVNLTKLESRPIPGMDFEFLFTFDFEASPKDGRVIQLLAELSSDPEITHFTFLGAYGEH